MFCRYSPDAQTAWHMVKTLPCSGLSADDRKRDGNAPSWGVETPVTTTVCRILAHKKSLAFAVGEPAAYVQAPKAKGHGDRVVTGFSNSPTSGSRAVCGGAPQTFSQSQRRSSSCSFPNSG